MKLHPNINLTTTITITDEEARVLEHLTSYSLADWFSQNCNSSEIPLNKIKDTLERLRPILRKIALAKKDALAVITQHQKEADELEMK